MTVLETHRPLPIPDGISEYTLLRYENIIKWLVDRNITTVAMFSVHTEETLRELGMPLGYRLTLKANLKDT
jgi:hypothetical protein